ncbi:MAG TPA: type IV pili methyl-accepting chemotaxis transducer N-terminal domain-containing protein [Aquabacterium sp.]|uniref:type IV pili methyl-accepting chemotaxis transducer N-terminal domain-containing protein n=1 Tax=Aquabacterium sp. TaxID=1872578 RepID=UPI002E2EC0D2|nr:type IV pili methyl-accepting chemotaxis transducer N-terminal domain-containing protein [Aquabacterium sp.]HEX5357846.1 type IV pili methyl-accepting chemotaxis transducer N-terminal domain-containing protein [Aquabacterium sp.]
MQSITCRREWMKQGLALAIGATMVRPASAQIVSLNEAINKAGRQRMLSQRMAKAWLAMGQGVDVKRAEKILFDSMAWFDRQFVELKAYAPTPEIESTYKALEPLWADYKAALVGSAPDRSAAPLLLSLDAKVLKLAHQGTVQLEQYSGKAVGKLVNVAGRQRMLSQRTAKFYLSQSWGAAVPEQLKELNTARQEFAQALQTLTTAPQATTAIKQELELARQQWIFFDNALSRVGERSSASQHATEVFASSENILQVMDKVTSLYSKLA